MTITLRSLMRAIQIFIFGERELVTCYYSFLNVEENAKLMLAVSLR